jgi:tetratricopeptide (TPR) repeat protein
MHPVAKCGRAFRVARRSFPYYDPRLPNNGPDMNALSRSLLSLCLLLAALPAVAEEMDNNLKDAINENEYESCMTLAQRTPAEAYNSAKSWSEKGGGAAAQHCGAVALIGMNKPKEAAEMMERAAESIRQEKPMLAAELYGQAGQAWTMADDVTHALNAQNEGLALAPDNTDLLVDRAISYAAKQDFRSAVADLDKAHELDAYRADVLTYRASAWRYLRDNKKALEDAEAALALEPQNPDALLERGIIRRLTDDPEGARIDWMQVMALAGGTPAGDAAKANLDKLDQKTP